MLLMLWLLAQILFAWLQSFSPLVVAVCVVAACVAAVGVRIVRAAPIRATVVRRILLLAPFFRCGVFLAGSWVCSKWASNVVFDERVTIPYIYEGVMTWCFLRRFFRRGCFFRLRCLGIATFDTFFEQNERMRGGRFRVRVDTSSSSFFAQRRTAVFSAICMTLLFG